MSDEILDNSEIVGLRRSKRKLLLGLVISLIVGYAISILIGFVEIESILFSGPIVLILSILIFIFAIRQKDMIAVSIGSIGAVSVLFLFFAIVFLKISPRRAEGIVPALASLPWLVILGLGIGFGVRSKRRKKTQTIR